MQRGKVMCLRSQGTQDSRDLNSGLTPESSFHCIMPAHTDGTAGNVFWKHQMKNLLFKKTRQDRQTSSEHVKNIRGANKILSEKRNN